MSTGQSNPLKPLIFGMLVMGFVAIATLAIRGAISLREQEAERQERNRLEREATQQRWRDEQAQRQAAEARRRSEAEAARLKREREAQAAAEEARRPIDVSAGLEQTRRRAAEGDPHAQHLLGFIYYVGLDSIVRMREGKTVVMNPPALQALTGQDLGSRPIGPLPAFKRDLPMAMSSLERAARQGHRGAQLLLGMANLSSTHGDPGKAYLWLLTSDGPPILEKELDVTYPQASVIRSMKENVRKKLTPEQAAAAEQQAKAFQPKKEKA